MARRKAKEEEQAGGSVLLEEALYEPVAAYFREKGYVVRGEVRDCDLVAQKGEDLIVVELKKGFTLKLLYQGLARQAMTDTVFVAIPRPKKPSRGREYQDMLGILKRLGLGLFFVSLDSPVPQAQVILLPQSGSRQIHTPKRAGIEKEMAGRALDLNIGGVQGKKIVTAFRERFLELCCLLECREKVSLKELRQMGFTPQSIQILQKNLLGCFVRLEKGVYALGEKGRQELKDAPDAVLLYYRKKWQGGS